MSVDHEKVEAVMSWERQKLVFEISNFLGLAGYYRRIIGDFSRLAALMTRLTRNEVKFEWNDLCEKAFHELKNEAYFSSYYDGPETETEVHGVL